MVRAGGLVYEACLNDGIYELNLVLFQVDELGAEARIWPRLSAVAERLWSDPRTTWRDAQRRLLQHRHRLAQRGVRADRLMPEYCRQNEGRCSPVGGAGNDGDGVGHGLRSRLGWTKGNSYLNSYLSDFTLLSRMPLGDGGNREQMLETMLEQHEADQRQEELSRNAFESEQENRRQQPKREEANKDFVTYEGVSHGADGEDHIVVDKFDDRFRSSAKLPSPLEDEGPRMGGLVTLAVACFLLYLGYLFRRGIMGFIFMLFKKEEKSKYRPLP